MASSTSTTRPPAAGAPALRTCPRRQLGGRLATIAVAAHVAGRTRNGAEHRSPTFIAAAISHHFAQWAIGFSHLSTFLLEEAPRRPSRMAGRAARCPVSAALTGPQRLPGPGPRSGRAAAPEAPWRREGRVCHAREGLAAKRPKNEPAKRALIMRAKRAKNECRGAAHSNPRRAPFTFARNVRQPPARPSFTAIALSCNQAFPIYPTRE